MLMYFSTHNPGMRKLILLLSCVGFLLNCAAQSKDKYILLKPDRVFDGEKMHTGWVVLVKNDSILQAGEMTFKLPAGSQVVELKGCTLLPGLIEGHSHLYLHPYNETVWSDQVLKESRAERTARAVNHAKATLLAGFTTVRDLGTEGAMYDDVGLKKAIEKKVIPGPRMIVSTRAIVATGTYAPRPASPDVEYPQGAEEVAGLDEMTKVIRSQISHGADFIKLYADYQYGPNGQTQPTFSDIELAWAVNLTNTSGRKTVAHATSPDGMKRAILAGVNTIEHGDGGTEEIFSLMKERNVAFCPTLAASEAVESYKGWKKGVDPDTKLIVEKKKSFTAAIKSGVTICMGGDVGVFTHGDNAREMELMVDYGMTPLDVIRSTTSINADVFGYANKIGRIKPGLLADIIAVEGDPTTNVRNIRNVKLVIKDGIIYKQP